MGDTFDPKYKKILISGTNYERFPVDELNLDPIDKSTKYNSAFVIDKKDQYNDEYFKEYMNFDILPTIKNIKSSLNTFNSSNSEFMILLSKNLQYYDEMVIKIKDKILQIFELIKYLNNGINININDNNDDHLIENLMKLVNKYLNTFQDISNEYSRIYQNQSKIHTELKTKSNILFTSISGLNETIEKYFSEIGIFNLGDDNNLKYFTYKTIQKKLLSNTDPVLTIIKDIMISKNAPNTLTGRIYDEITDLLKKNNDIRKNLLQLMDEPEVTGAAAPVASVGLGPAVPVASRPRSGPARPVPNPQPTIELSNHYPNNGDVQIMPNVSRVAKATPISETDKTNQNRLFQSPLGQGTALPRSRFRLGGGNTKKRTKNKKRVKKTKRLSKRLSKRFSKSKASRSKKA